MNTLEQLKTAYNRRLAKKRIQCLNEDSFFLSSSLLVGSLVLRNPLLRQAPKRWQKILKTVLKIRSNYLKSYNRKVGKNETATKNNLKVGKSKFNIV